LLNAVTQEARSPSAHSLTQPHISIITRSKIKASTAQVWWSLMFYEQIQELPPLHLRVLLPLPIGTEGSKLAVGDVATCLYQGGHLLKRVTQIHPRRRYEFAVVEQNLRLGGGILLSGGSYALRELRGGGTELAVTTRYVSCRRPRWLWKRIEATVCHMFHRHLLSAIQKKVEA
jgi:hypothetical protein